MKKSILALVASCLLTSSYAGAELPKPVVPPVALAPLPTFRAPIVRTCIDPAAASIDFSITNRTSLFGGVVRVVGKVKNVGNATFESGRGQQIAQLLEIVPGGTPRVVASAPFERLAPGAEVPLVFSRAWNASSPAEGEFPPTYRLVLSYDPDIAIDGNTKNDDCRTDNNRLERSGTAINALFR
jgi:hypothetical protein